MNSSCNNFLDIVPDRIATIESSFAMEVKAKQFLFTCYSYLPNCASLSANPAWFGGDELYAIKETAQTYGLYGWQISQGNQNAASVYCNYWEGSGGGKKLYQGINDCNIFLENIDKVPDMTIETRSRWISEVKFLKAYYHYWLVRLYGPIPIKDVIVPVSAPTEELRVHRNTLDECFDYIVETLDAVIADSNLPDKIDNLAEELGRITRPIAMAVKAEVLVTAASELFNGNMEYSGVTDNRGIEIFSPNKTPEEKLARWETAAEACREAIDLCHSIGLKLYTNSDTPELSIYHENIRNQMNHRCVITQKWNSEIIWANSNSTSALQTYAMVRGITSSHAGSMAVRGWIAAPLKIADKFYTKNGVPITEDQSWIGYNDRNGIMTATEDQVGMLHKGYKTAKINFDREIRYYANLGFDGNEWFGNGATINLNTNASNWYIAAKRGGAAQVGDANSFNATNIWIKKLVNWESSLSTTSFTATYYPWPIMRLGNLYLLYAEALNEWGEDHGNEALVWIDKIRERANLESVADSWSKYSIYPDKYKNQAGRREIIRQERTVELAFEGQRFWDVRRWKTAHVEFNQNITGWSYQGKTEEEYYKEALIYTQKFKMRDYWWPISTNEILANSNTMQNPGW